MSISIGIKNIPKTSIGNLNISKISIGGDKVVYSSGNIVTYYVDSGKMYKEEVEEGASCLSPKTFTPTKSGWTFVGWRINSTATSEVFSSLVMGENPISLYAVFRQTVTVTYYNASTTASTKSGYRYYNNGNTANPAFSITPASLSGWTFRYWATSSAATAGIAYSAISNTQFASSVTLYAAYYKTLTLSYNGNGASSGSVSAQTGYQYWNTGNISNPSFTLKANGFVLSGYSFSKWALGSSAGTQYAVGSTVTISSNTTMYAVWISSMPSNYIYQNGKPNTAIGVGNPTYTYELFDGNISDMQQNITYSGIGIQAKLTCNAKGTGPRLYVVTHNIPTVGFSTINWSFDYRLIQETYGISTPVLYITCYKKSGGTEVIKKEVELSGSTDISQYSYVSFKFGAECSGGNSGLIKTIFVGITNIYLS